MVLSAVTQWIAERALLWTITTASGVTLSGKFDHGHLGGIILGALPWEWSPLAQAVSLWLLAWSLWRGMRFDRWIESALALVSSWLLFTLSQGALYVPGSFLTWWFVAEPTATPARWASAIVFLVVVGYVMVGMQVKPVEHLHGSARFAEREDLEERGLLGEKGIVLGWDCQERRFLGDKWRPIRHSGVEHVLVLGETRAGKTSEQLIPTLLDWEGHVVVGDFKDGELYERTAGELSRRGFRVIRFDPLSSEGMAWNPLLEIEPGQQEIGQLLTIAEALIPLDPKGTEHFPKAARELFLGLALHVLYANPPGQRSIGAIRDLLLEGTQDGAEDSNASSEEERAGKGLYRLFRRLAGEDHDSGKLYDSFASSDSGTHPEVRRIALGMLETPEKELGSIGSTLRQALQPWSDPFVAESTRVSKFKLGLVRRNRTPTAIYMTIPLAEMDRLGPLIRLFTVAAAKRLTELGSYVDQAADKREIHRALMVLEEFPAMGKVEYVARMLSTVGGYGLTMMLCVQTLSQLKTIYGANEPISGGCPVMVVNSTKDLETMKAVSTWSGEMTVVRAKSSRSHSWKSGASTTHSKEEVKRPLVTQGEVRNFPEGRGLVLFPSCPPILTHKVGYYRLPEMLARSEVPPPSTSDTLEDPFCAWSGVQPARWEGMSFARAIQNALEGKQNEK